MTSLLSTVCMGFKDALHNRVPIISMGVGYILIRSLNNSPGTTVKIIGLAGLILGSMTSCIYHSYTLSSTNNIWWLPTNERELIIQVAAGGCLYFIKLF